MTAEAHFRESVRLDPDFGSAWAALAETVIPLHEVHRVRDAEAAYALATDAARRALTVRRRAPEGHAALAHILMHQYSWRAAEEEALLAVKESPGSAISHIWLGWVMQALGRFSESERAFRQGIDLDPLSGVYHYQLAVSLLVLNRPEEAVRVAERGLQLGSGLPVVPAVLGTVQLGRFESARDLLRKAPAGTPSHIIPALTIYVDAAAGRHADARAQMSKLRETVTPDEPVPMMVPFAYARLGQPDAAVDWLQRSPDAGEFLVEYRLLPEMRALASNKAMRDLLNKFGFTEP